MLVAQCHGRTSTPAAKPWRALRACPPERARPGPRRVPGTPYGRNRSAGCAGAGRRRISGGRSSRSHSRSGTPGRVRPEPAHSRASRS
ncbi:Hypothetical protein SCLAV_3893 [Streptomyces clavuligerus]|uniref:Uncharacterized protein n=1 Tax=Streptomyces clavuligerus TaxID=1901 RepID=E2Q429_STRCL|nr:Hypothetical protein SCLAV_3893 [Streptomyces clavuligerus]